jgi:hypothetical protein
VCLELGRAGIQGVVASSALKVASLGEIAAIFSTTVGFRPVVPQDAKLFGVELEQSIYIYIYIYIIYT